MSIFSRSLNELSETTIDFKAVQIPEVPLQEFQVCASQSWRAGEIAYTVLLVVYGMFCRSLHYSTFTWHQSTSFIEDCAAFLVIAFSAWRWGLVYAAGVPTLIGNIVRGGTVYFLVIFVCQLLLIFFNVLPPVSDLSTDSFSPTHLIMAAHRDRSIGYQERESSPSNIPIRLKPTIFSPTHSGVIA